MTSDSTEPSDSQNDSGQHDSGQLTPEDRAKKFAEKPPLIPRKAIVAAALTFVILGLGGALFDHFLGGPVSSTLTTAATDPPGLETTTTKPRSGETTPSTEPVVAHLPADLAALMGLAKLSGSSAPGFTLTTGTGSKIALGSFRGKVVVVSFFDSRCNDICPVLESELRQANLDLGEDASQVVMLTVNTDPFATSIADANVAASRTVLRSVTDWRFLTGTLGQLNAVWKAYGVTIDAQASTKLVSHDEVLYFIDPEGRLRFSATPFANEADNGSFSLPVSTQKLFASGVAGTARSLIGKNQLTSATDGWYLGQSRLGGGET